MNARSLRKGLAACLGAAGSLFLHACSQTPTAPLETVPSVDLKRYMGSWYVIANIPPWIEKDAQNSIESYTLDTDGTVAISSTYRNGGPEAEQKRLTSRGFVLNAPANSIWDVQFIWPLRLDYRITHLSADYSQTIVSRVKRDYVWIMARTPMISDADYERLAKLVAAQGYDVTRLRKVPQQWK